MQTVEREPTCNWLKLIEKRLVDCTEEGFEQYLNVGMLTELGVRAGVESGDVDTEKLAVLANVQEPKTLFIPSDQESLQLTGTNFLRGGLQITAEPIADPYHRRPNDIKLSLTEAGLWWTYLDRILLYNISHGPWEKAAWFRQLQHSATQCVRAMSPDDPLLLKLWPSILKDKGIIEQDCEEVSGRAARAAYLRNFDHGQTFSTVGKKCSTGKWFSWQDAHDKFDPVLGDKALAASKACLEAGFCLASEELLISSLLMQTRVESWEYCVTV